jgi:hypothetical protein
LPLFTLAWPRHPNRRGRMHPRSAPQSQQRSQEKHGGGNRDCPTQLTCTAIRSQFATFVTQVFKYPIITTRSPRYSGRRPVSNSVSSNTFSIRRTFGDRAPQEAISYPSTLVLSDNTLLRYMHPYFVSHSWQGGAALTHIFARFVRIASLARLISPQKEKLADSLMGINSRW